MRFPTYKLIKPALDYIPAGTAIVGVERMSAAFTKYHLDDGRALHRFAREEPHAQPHDHPWAFDTDILEGGYVEEVFAIDGDGSWRSEIVHRSPYTAHHIDAAHIHRIVQLPNRTCWTLVKAGEHERTVRFWRFDDHGARSRAWNGRRWS